MNLEVKVYPAEQVKNNNLGGGSVNVGGLIAKFSLWQNDKFSKGFAISFPYRKDGTGKVHNEVYFLDKDLSDKVYDLVEPHIAHLIGGGGQPNVNTNYQVPQQSTPNTIQRQDVNPQAGAPSGPRW